MKSEYKGDKNVLLVISNSKIILIRLHVTIIHRKFFLIKNLSHKMQQNFSILCGHALLDRTIQIDSEQQIIITVLSQYTQFRMVREPIGTTGANGHIPIDIK